MLKLSEIYSKSNIWHVRMFFHFGHVLTSSTCFVLRFRFAGVFRAGSLQLHHLVAEWEEKCSVCRSSGGRLWAEQEECDGQKQQGSLREKKNKNDPLQKTFEQLKSCFKHITLSFSFCGRQQKTPSSCVHLKENQRWEKQIQTSLYDIKRCENKNREF